MENNSISKRIDFLRSIAITMVIVAHIMPYAELTIISNIVSKIAAYTNAYVFMFISGYLYESNREKYKMQKKGDFVKNKTKRILIPYFTWNILMYISCIILSKLSFVTMLIDLSEYANRTILETVFDFIIFDNMIVVHLWYLYVLFVIFIILAICHHKRIHIWEVALLFLFSSMILFCFRGSIPSIVDHFLRSIPIFSFGRVTYVHKLFDKTSLKMMIVDMVLWIMLFVERGFTHFLEGLFVYFVDFGLIVMSIIVLTNISGLIFTFSIGGVLDVITQKIANNSYAIYLMHTPYFVLPLSIFMSKLGMPWFMMLITITPVCVIVPCVIRKMIKKNHWTSIFLLGED